MYVSACAERCFRVELSSQVLEFVDFKRRLEQSHSLAVAQTEQALLALRRAVPQGYSSIHTALQGFSQTDAQIQPQAARPAAMPSLAQLRFNEDLSTRPTWLPPQGASPAAQGLSWWEQQPKQNQTGEDSAVPEHVLARPCCLPSISFPTICMHVYMGRRNLHVCVPGTTRWQHHFCLCSVVER